MELAPGLLAELRMVVSEADTAIEMGSGDVPVCIAPDGQLFMAPTTNLVIVLTDDARTHYLTDNSGNNYLTAEIPAGSCIEQ